MSVNNSGMQYHNADGVPQQFIRYNPNTAPQIRGMNTQFGAAQSNTYQGGKIYPNPAVETNYEATREI